MSNNLQKNILEQIVDDKRIEVAALKRAKPLVSFIDELLPTTKDMYAALKRTADKPNAGFNFECKKSSPSKGLIRPDFDIKAICQTYDKYAAAISVLTDKKYFQGTFEHLKIVTETVSCPVLNKDFFVDAYQVYLARYYGADAVLLMLSVLSDEEYLELAGVAERYNLSVLTEISNEQERDRAIVLKAKMIGINNRNLRDLSTDIARTFDFAPSLPDDRIIISESGLYSNAQIRELAPAVDGFLVGSSLMAPDNNPYQDIDLACRKLIFGHHKVCGLTSTKDAQSAAEAGARFGGLIFADKSPRCISLDTAKDIVKNTQSKLEYIGVFVNDKHENIISRVQQLELSAVQLHGSESSHYIATLSTLLMESGCDDCQIWQASPINNEIPVLDDLSSLISHHVLDGKSPGSGETFNWQLLSESQQDLTNCLLAGGLNNDNIETALNQLSDLDLFGLDLNSGVEVSPGIKSDHKLQKIFAQIRHF